MLTQAILKENLHYDPETGVFTWLKQSGRTFIGKKAGTKNGSGYLLITINRKQYRAHRLAWLYIKGSFPPIYIDHKDGIKTNNKFDNLREATESQNCMNKKMQSNNTSGFIGVHKNKEGKWTASAKKGERKVNLGRFDFAEDASNAYQHFIKNNRGEFSYPMWNEAKPIGELK
jgi:hypothetical protein